MDEFAIALHRDAAVCIDATLGWHLWATDLCLQAQQRAGQACGHVLEVPLFHNSTTAYSLPQAFHDSARVLLEKHAALDQVPTLCGRIAREAAAKTPALRSALTA
jgi:hypothetical protein